MCQQHPSKKLPLYIPILRHQTFGCPRRRQQQQQQQHLLLQMVPHRLNSFVQLNVRHHDHRQQHHHRQHHRHPADLHLRRLPVNSTSTTDAAAQYKSHLTPHTSHVTRHTSHVTRHLLPQIIVIRGICALLELSFGRDRRRNAGKP
jgi:hypothetical protein